MTEVQQDIPWYERPIEVGMSPAVKNGSAETRHHYLPERHYWPDIESQRQDIAELQYFEGQLAFKAALKAFQDVITASFFPDYDASEEGEDDASQD